jgi:hypothetical protein
MSSLRLAENQRARRWDRTVQVLCWLLWTGILVIASFGLGFVYGRLDPLP